jgi:hypothetical protein
MALTFICLTCIFCSEAGVYLATANPKKIDKYQVGRWHMRE